jgi:hypothetical protein
MIHERSLTILNRDTKQMYSQFVLQMVPVCRINRFVRLINTQSVVRYTLLLTADNLLRIFKNIINYRLFL